MKELQSLGLDMRLYTKDNKEVELKEDIDEGIDYNEAKKKEDLVLNESEIEDSYIEADEEEIDVDKDDDSDELFVNDELLDDEGLYGDLAKDNLDEDEDLD